jgi:hypothetical protein
MSSSPRCALPAALTMVVPSNDLPSAPRRSAGHGVDRSFSASPLDERATASPMRNFCFAVGETRSRSGSSRLCSTAWHGVHPSLSRSARHSAPRLRVSPKSLLALRKSLPRTGSGVVPSIRAGVSIPHKRSSSAPARRHASAWHGVLRSEIRRQKPDIRTRTAEGPRPSVPTIAPGEDTFWFLTSDFCRLIPAGHGVHRSFLRVAPRPAAAPALDLT